MEKPSQSPSQNEPLEEARNGMRCRFCFSRTNDLEEVPLVPKEHRAVDAGTPRETTLCQNCRSSIREIFDDEFFHKAGIILESVRVNNQDVLAELPVDESTSHNPESIDICTVCNVTDPRVIERHHSLPRRHLPSGFQDAFDLVPLCSNCHNRIERIFDDYFFEQIGINTGISRQESGQNPPSSQSLPSVRSLLKDFVEDECRYSEDEFTRSRIVSKTFYHYIEEQGYEYNATNNCIHRTIDEFAEYATWVHDPENATHNVRGGYWSYGRFENLILPNASSYLSSSPPKRTLDEFSDNQPKPVMIGHGDFLSGHLYGMEYSSEMDVLAVAVGIENRTEHPVRVSPGFDCTLNESVVRPKSEGRFDGIPNSWSYVIDSVGPSEIGFYIFFVETPPSTIIDCINFEREIPFNDPDSPEFWGRIEDESFELPLGGVEFEEISDLPSGLNLGGMTIE